MNWLLVSLALSVILTVVANLAIGARGRGHRRRMRSMTSGIRVSGRSVGRSRVFFPWKAMLALSIVATVLLNVLLNVVGR